VQTGRKFWTLTFSNRSNRREYLYSFRLALNIILWRGSYQHFNEIHGSKNMWNFLPSEHQLGKKNWSMVSEIKSEHSTEKGIL
jgi:hypothetical protein